MNEVIDHFVYEKKLLCKPDNEEDFLSSWDNILCAVIETNDHCAIRRLITKSKFGPKAQKCLIENGIPEDLFTYELIWGKLNRYMNDNYFNY